MLDVQAADKDGAKEGGGEQPVRVYAVRHAVGEQLVSKLRSQFVVVNHEKAEARFAVLPGHRAQPAVNPT